MLWDTLSYCYHPPFSSSLVFDILPWRRMFYLHLVGNWCTTLYLDDRMAFFFLPSSSKTLYSLSGMVVLLKVAEWVGNGHEQMLFLVLDASETQKKSPIILPLQTFFSRFLLLRRQVFSAGNFAQERPTTTTTTIKTQVFVFRYERVTSTGKFTIVAVVVFLLNKIYKRDVLYRAVFKVKTLAVLFPPYL